MSIIIIINIICKLSRKFTLAAVLLEKAKLLRSTQFSDKEGTCLIDGHVAPGPCRSLCTQYIYSVSLLAALTISTVVDHRLSYPTIYRLQRRWISRSQGYREHCHGMSPSLQQAYHHPYEGSSYQHRSSTSVRSNVRL